jgi:hypothetical protein
MSGISRMIAKQLSASLGFTDEARPALRLTDQPPKASYSIYGEAAGENIASFYSPSIEVLNEITIPKKGLLGREAIIALNKSPDTRSAEVETIVPLINEDKRYTREELSGLLETNMFKVRAMRTPDAFGLHDVGTGDYIPSYDYASTQRQKNMILEPEFEELDYQESIITAERTSPEAIAQYGKFEASMGQHYTNETLAHWRHSIQKDTRNNDKYYLIEEFQSDLVSKPPVPARPKAKTAAEGLKNIISPKLDYMRDRLFKDFPALYDDNRDFFLDYGAAYAEISSSGLGNIPSALEGSVDSFIKKYKLDVKILKPEDIKNVPNLEDYRVSYKGTDEALEFARIELNEPNLSGEDLVNNLIKYSDYSLIERPDKYRHLIRMYDDFPEMEDQLNYIDDLQMIGSLFDYKITDKPEEFASREIKEALRKDLSSATYDYLIEKAVKDYDISSDFYKASENLNNALRFVQSNAMEQANNTLEQLTAPVASAPIKKLEEVTKIILQAAIKDAAANGITKVVIPNIQRIAALREKVGSDPFNSMVKKGSSFYKIYDKGVKKALDDIKKGMPDIKVYQEDIPYGRKAVEKKDANVSYTGDTISLVKVRRMLEEAEEGGSLGANGRPISGPELIENIFRYSEADEDQVPSAYREFIDFINFGIEDGPAAADAARLRVGLGLPYDADEMMSLSGEFLRNSGEGRLITVAEEALPKDATFIDITPYINKDYVLRFNKGGLVERPTK